MFCTRRLTPALSLTSTTKTQTRARWNLQRPSGLGHSIGRCLQLALRFFLFQHLHLKVSPALNCITYTLYRSYLFGTCKPSNTVSRDCIVCRHPATHDANWQCTFYNHSKCRHVPKCSRLCLPHRKHIHFSPNHHHTRNALHSRFPLRMPLLVRRRKILVAALWLQSTTGHRAYSQVPQRLNRLIKLRSMKSLVPRNLAAAIPPCPLLHLRSRTCLNRQPAVHIPSHLT